jgi:hypothetical protein
MEAKTNPDLAMPNDRFLTAYVDLPFLKKLFREKPEDLGATPDDDWPMVWQNVYRFLQLSADIVVDAEEQVIESQRIVARFLIGGGFYRHVDFQPGVSERFTDPGSFEVDSHPFSVFLLEDADVPSSTFRNQTGLLFLDFEDLKVHWSQVLEAHSLNVLPKDRIPGGRRPFQWEDLQVHAGPVNAVVIADKYAYRQFYNGAYKKNLGELLLNLVPDVLSHPVHITLVTDLTESIKKDCETSPKEDWPHPKDIRKEIRDHLDKHRPELDVRLGVVGYGDDGHKDRFIFTNYGLFTSNDSFSFFDGRELDKETLVTYLPSSTHGSSVVEPRLKRMAKYLSNLDCFNTAPYSGGSGKEILLADGDDRNRLLDVAE